jgi:hypothetical protein
MLDVKVEKVYLHFCYFDAKNSSKYCKTCSIK